MFPTIIGLPDTSMSVSTLVVQHIWQLPRSFLQSYEVSIVIFGISFRVIIIYVLLDLNDAPREIPLPCFACMLKFSIAYLTQIFWFWFAEIQVNTKFYDVSFLLCSNILIGALKGIYFLHDIT